MSLPDFWSINRTYVWCNFSGSNGSFWWCCFRCFDKKQYVWWDGCRWFSFRWHICVHIRSVQLEKTWCRTQRPISFAHRSAGDYGQWDLQRVRSETSGVSLPLRWLLSLLLLLLLVVWTWLCMHVCKCTYVKLYLYISISQSQETQRNPSVGWFFFSMLQVYQFTMLLQVRRFWEDAGAYYLIWRSWIHGWIHPCAVVPLFTHTVPRPQLTLVRAFDLLCRVSRVAKQGGLTCWSFLLSWTLQQVHEVLNEFIAM